MRPLSTDPLNTNIDLQRTLPLVRLLVTSGSSKEGTSKCILFSSLHNVLLLQFRHFLRFPLLRLWHRRCRLRIPRGSSRLLRRCCRCRSSCLGIPMDPLGALRDLLHFGRTLILSEDDAETFASRLQMKKK